MRGAVGAHPLVRSLAKPALVAASTATAGLNLVAFEKARGEAVLGFGFDHLFQFVLLLGALTVLFLGETGRRAGGWTLGLPLTARELWTDHLRALLAAFAAVLLVQAVIVVGFAQLIGRLSSADMLGLVPLLSRFVRPGAVLAALALVLAARRPDLADPESEPGWRRFRLLLGLAALALLAGLVPLPAAWSALPALAAAAWSWRVRGGLPPVLSVAVADARAAAGEGAHRRRGGAVRHLVLRQLFKWPLTWVLGLPLILVLGLIIGGVANGAEDADFAQLFNLWIAVYMLVAFSMHFLENLGRVDHLPVPRGLLLRWLLLPGLATILVGALGGSALVGAGGSGGESLVFAEEAETCCPGLRVPADAWRPVWGEPPGAVTAPWGESVAPTSVEVVRGLPVRLWKPYTTDAASSPGFVAWQIARAAARVHGVEIDPDAIRDRYLQIDDAGRVVAREGGLTLVADGLVPARGAVGPLLPLLVGFVVVATLLAAWSIFRPLGPGATRRRVRWVFGIHMGALLAIHLGGYGLLMTRTASEWAVGGLVRGRAADLAALGAVGWVAPWLAVALLAWPAWLLCARAFARVEAVRPGAGSCHW